MEGSEKWHNNDSYMLKECYEIASQYESLDISKSVLRERSRRIDLTMDYVPVQTGSPIPQSDMQVLSEAMRVLSLADYSSPNNSVQGLRYKLNTLSDSGEREFVLSLLALSNGTSDSVLIEAAEHVIKACSISPNDPRYIALAKILSNLE